MSDERRDDLFNIDPDLLKREALDDAQPESEGETFSSEEPGTGFVMVEQESELDVQTDSMSKTELTAEADSASSDYFEPETGYTQDTVSKPETDYAPQSDPEPVGSTAYTNTTYTGGYTHNYGDTQANADGLHRKYARTYQSDQFERATFNAVPPEPPKRDNGSGSAGSNSSNGFGKKLARTVALALVFGLVSGGVFRGVTTIGVKNNTNTAVSQEAETTDAPVIQNDEEGPVESTPVTQVTLTTDVSEIAANALPSIVQVSNISLVQYRSFFGQMRTYEVPSSGSGIIVSQDDDYLYIATNNHVVANASELTITFNDEASAAAVIVDTLPEKDLAVVAVRLSDLSDETMDAIKVATLGNSEDLIVGQGAIVIGNALGYGQSVTVGYISAKDREVSIENDDGTVATNLLIQTDAAVNPGNSGGALLNMRGEVIGIVSAKYSDTSVEGMGYAIPISDAIEIINQMIDKGVDETVDISSGSLANNGQGSSGQNNSGDLPAGSAYLGIYGMDISEETAETYGMPAGVYVSQVIHGSAAEEAGLNRGDVILAVDGTEISSMTEVREYITNKKPGDTIEITYATWNSDYEEEETVSATLGEVK